MKNNIKNLRQKLGIPQAELAKRLKISRSYMSNIEQNKKTPSMMLAARIAKELNCSLDDIFLKS